MASLLDTSVVVILAACAAGMAQEDRPPCRWESDVAAAQRVARREGKDLLVYLTSPDGCGWCRVLERKVLSTKEFSRAGSDFVLVRLDFPVDDSRLDAETRARNERWKELWGVAGFPTIVLADAEARPFGVLVGHQPDGPEVVLDRLAAARAARGRAVALFRRAERADAHERAKLIDEALSALSLPPEQLVRTYREEIETILAGPAEDTLRLRYRRLLDDEADRAFQEEVRRKVREVSGAAATSEAAVAVLDEALATPNLSKSRREWLLIRKANSLYTDGALAGAEAALSAALEGCDPRENPNSEVFRAQMVFESGRTDEGSRRLDRLAELYADLPEPRWSALDRKAQVLDRPGHTAEALAAADVALAAAVAPRHRYVTQVKRAALLLKSGRAADSADASRSALAALRAMDIVDASAAHSLLDLAVALRATGDEAGASVAAETSRQILRSFDPAALADEWFTSKLAQFPPVAPLEAPRSH